MGTAGKAEALERRRLVTVSSSKIATWKASMCFGREVVVGCWWWWWWLRMRKWAGMLGPAQTESLRGVLNIVEIKEVSGKTARRIRKAARL
jgi:hypothetical protein